ncbi:MAG: D-alanyl-D-alanine carboxypeptidase family protein [Ruminococcus sp.]|nr:D-alanyl-D-alanine carboxypeptidase family protein [Ruminococcus sp.]
MAKSKMKLRFPNIILLLCGLILLIFLFDFLWRNILSPTVPGDTESIISAEGNFAASDPTGTDSEQAPSDSTEENSSDSTEATEEATQEDINSETITLTQGQIHNGPLILVSSTCPFLGQTDFIDFTSNTNTNVIPRDLALQFHPDMKQPMSDLFDGYCRDNGYVNLQIYSTSEINAASNSLYTTVLSERSSGYTFDIGLITSTGEVVAYLTKRNEWMFGNCWNYGFVVRYSDTKTGTTGVGFMPHHFRYVGLPHSLIMYEKEMCLEEYLQYLTDYTMDTAPLTYQTEDTAYEIYYVPAEESGDTTVTIPKGTKYTVSGNNTDGFILTLEKANTEEPGTGFDPETSTPESTDVSLPETEDTTTTTTDSYSIG